MRERGRASGQRLSPSSGPPTVAAYSAPRPSPATPSIMVPTLSGGSRARGWPHPPQLVEPGTSTSM
eukprot:12203804-Alexandrium_andersonii.AAC.1